ncbi:MAG: TAXI family TRAP transporter solute-binding subunit [Spirochaetes bacterium]|nr:TAXI family TRAP transporter solute-binding subunit [Spirochaetota bacterium]
MKKLFAFVIIATIAFAVVFAAPVFINLATGGAAGTYFPLGGAMAEIWNTNIKNMNATAQTSGASAANINLLRDKNADVIIVQNDVAFYAINGVELFKEKYPMLLGMACLYNETCQLVSIEGTGVKTLADLKGKRIAVGAAGSGVEANARQIMEMAGITYADIKVQYLNFADAVNNLKDGNIDAAFLTAGHPTAAVQDLAVSKKLVVLSIPKDIAGKLQQKYPFYAPVVIPANTYPGQTSDVQTLAVKAMLACSKDLPTDTVYQMLKTMYANGAKLKATHKVGEQIIPANGKSGMSLKLHPGAEKYFKEAGVK